MSELEPSFWLDEEHKKAVKPAPTAKQPERPSSRYAGTISSRRNLDSISSRTAPQSKVNLAPTQTADKIIHVKLSLPKLPAFLHPKTYSSKLKTQLLSKKASTSFAIITIAIIGLTASKAVLKKDNNAGEQAKGKSTTDIAKKASINPLLPTDKQGQTKTLDSSYDKTKQVYSYEDTYQGAKFTVSQQTVPELVKKDNTVFKKAAEAINAKHSLDTTKGTVYIATNDKFNTQMAVLQTKTQLVFVQSNVVLDDYFWVKYINNLKFSS